MLRIAVPDLVSNSYFPAIAAVELGFFKSQGYDASIDLLFPVPKTFEALRDGQLDFVVGSKGTAATQPALPLRNHRELHTERVNVTIRLRAVAWRDTARSQIGVRIPTNFDHLRLAAANRDVIGRCP